MTKTVFFQPPYWSPEIRNRQASRNHKKTKIAEVENNFASVIQIFRPVQLHF